MWNWLDLFGSLSLMIHCFGFLQLDFGQNIEIFYQQYEHATIIAALFLLLRGVSRLSPFSTQIRLLLGVFIQTFKDIYAFVVLFMYMIMSMSIMHVVAKRADPKY